MRLPTVHGMLTREVMALVEQSLTAQEGSQRCALIHALSDSSLNDLIRGWGMKNVNKIIDTFQDAVWHSVESKAVQIEDLTASDIIIA